MATDPLTYVAQRASLDRAKSPRGRDRDWQALLIEQDADAIWRKILALVRVAQPDGEAQFDQMTQELFLYLLAADRLNYYLDQDYSDEQIRLDIFSMLSG
jgi:hypothetical protein